MRLNDECTCRRKDLPGIVSIRSESIIDYRSPLDTIHTQMVDHLIDSAISIAKRLVSDKRRLNACSHTKGWSKQNTFNKANKNTRVRQKMTTRRATLLVALILLGLCVMALASRDSNLDCHSCGGFGKPYRCPERGVWKCDCPSNKSWCSETNRCRSKEKSESCNPKCVKGTIKKICPATQTHNVGLTTNTPTPSAPRAPEPKCTEKCVCRQGWSGKHCDRKKVEVTVSKKHGRACADDTECTQKISIKCRCQKSKSRRRRSYSSTNDSYHRSRRSRGRHDSSTDWRH